MRQSVPRQDRLRNCSSLADDSYFHSVAADRRWICGRVSRLRQGRGRDSDGGTTERAEGDGSEPGVDALGMEGVAAGGEETELIVRAEGAEADCAIGRITGDGGEGGQGEQRERVD